MIIVAGYTISPQKDPLPKLVKGFFVLGIDMKRKREYDGKHNGLSKRVKEK